MILTIALTSYSFSANSEENSVQSEPKSTSNEDLIKAQAEIDRLEAEIQKQEKLGKRPRKKFVGARIKDYNLALYVEAWRQRVEWAGNLHYPKKAKEQHIYGNVQVTVSIKASGELEHVEIDKSSGNKVLDDAVIETVKIAAPFAKFSDEMKKDTDILSITRTWTFTSESMGVEQNWFLKEIEINERN